MAIKKFRDSLATLSENNLLKLLTNVVLPNIDDVRDFSSTDMYFVDDFVIRNHNGQYKLYRCVCDMVTGEFNDSKWVQIELSQIQKTTAVRSIVDIKQIVFEAKVESMAVLNLADHLEDPDLDYKYVPLVFHSMYGFLDRHEYIFDVDSAEIRFNSTELVRDESAVVFLFVIGRGTESYSSLEQAEFLVQKGATTLNISSMNPPNADSKMFIYNNSEYIDSRTYTYSKGVITFKQALADGGKLRIILFNKQEVKGQSSVQYCTHTARRAKETRINVPVNYFKYGRDNILLFHSVLGFIDFYSSDATLEVSIDKKRYTVVLSDRNALEKGQSLFILGLTTKYYDPIGDGEVGTNNLTTELVGKIESYTNRYTISVRAPKITVPLPEFAKESLDGYTVSTAIVNCSGDMGSLLITKKPETVDIEMTGIAESGMVEVTIRG